MEKPVNLNAQVLEIVKLHKDGLIVSASVHAHKSIQSVPISRHSLNQNALVDVKPDQNVSTDSDSVTWNVDVFVMKRLVKENKFSIRRHANVNVQMRKMPSHVEKEKTSVQSIVVANVRVQNQPTDVQVFKNGTKIHADVNVQRISPRQHVQLVKNGITINANADVQHQHQNAHHLKNTQM